MATGENAPPPLHLPGDCDVVDFHFFLNALVRNGWWWSGDRRVLIHPRSPDYRVWFDRGSGNLGFSDRMTDVIVERIVQR